jgi:hypothetical protein
VSLFVKKDGIYRRVNGLYQKVGGQYKEVTRAFLKSSGSYIEAAVLSLFQQAISAARAAGGPYLDIEDRFLELGPELVVNGDFSNGTTGWTPIGSNLSVVDGELRILISSAVNTQASQPLAFVVGKTYLVAYTARRGTTSGSVRVRGGGVNFGPDVSSTSNVSYSGTVTATTTAPLELVFLMPQLGQDAYFDNISVREILSADVWQDSAGTIPATIGSTVGLLTDRSFGGELGGEIVPVDALSTPASWALVQPTSGSVSVASGSMVINSADGSYCEATLIGSNATVDKFYVVTCTVSSPTGGGVRIDVGGAIGPARTVAGTYTHVAKAVNTNRVAVVRGSGVASSGTFSNISIRELKGNHATQATAGNRFLLELYNGHPMLRGNGASTSAQFATNPIGPTLSQPYTIIVGGVVGALGANRTMCGDTTRGAGIDSSGKLRITHHSAATVVGTASLAQGVAFVAEYVWDGASATIWLNGALDKPATALAASPTAAGGFFIGQRGNSAEFWNGLLLPVFARGVVLPEAQRRQIGRGMAQKLGVTYA